PDVQIDHPVVTPAAAAARCDCVGRRPPRPVGWPGAFQPRAPTDPGVTVSSYRALIILITRLLAQTQSMPSARTSAGIAGQSPANTGMLLSSLAAFCTCCGSSVSSRHLYAAGEDTSQHG